MLFELYLRRLSCLFLPLCRIQMEGQRELGMAPSYLEPPWTGFYKEVKWEVCSKVFLLESDVQPFIEALSARIHFLATSSLGFRRVSFGS